METKHSLECHVVAACIGIALAIVTVNGKADVLQAIFLVAAGGMLGALKTEEDKP